MAFLPAVQHHRVVGYVDRVTFCHGAQKPFGQAFGGALGEVTPSGEALLALKLQLSLHGLGHEVDGMIVQQRSFIVQQVAGNVANFPASPDPDRAVFGIVDGDGEPTIAGGRGRLPSANVAAALLEIAVIDRVSVVLVLKFFVRSDQALVFQPCFVLFVFAFVEIGDTGVKPETVRIAPNGKGMNKFHWVCCHDSMISKMGDGRLNIPKARIWYGLPIAGAGFFGGYFIQGFMSHPPIGSADLAAWVQAIGAISAIAGAYILGERQARAALDNSIKAQKIAVLEKQRAFFAICTAADNRARNIWEIYKGDKFSQTLRYSTYDESVVRSIVGALAAIPLHEIDSPDAIEALLNMKDQFVFAANAIRQYEDDRKNGHAQNADIERIFCQNVQRHVALLFEYYETLKNTIGLTGESASST